MILTPLGILAVGSAWGEWTAQDFSDPQVRRQIAAASRNQAPPARCAARSGAALLDLDGSALALCAVVHPQRFIRLSGFRNGGSRPHHRYGSLLLSRADPTAGDRR